MTTNDDSAPNMPTPIDPASQIALAFLADYFNERHTNRAAFAEQCREDDPDAYPEQMAIADTWRRAANIVSVIAHSRPGGPETSWKFTLKIGASELGKLIAMATASTPERIAELEVQVADRERAIERYRDGANTHIEKMSKVNARIAELEARSPANECSDGERTQYELTIAQQQKRIAELETSTKQAWRERDYFQSRASENPTKALVVRLESERDAARTEILVLQARIDELTTVPVVDGQTPGEVLILSQQGCEPRLVSLEMLASAEIDARAVLRVFGNGAAALQRVRDTIETTRIESFAARQETLVQCTANAAYLHAIKVINAELAALTPAK